jgi:hypothetical protein
MSAQLTITIPIWLDFIFTCPLLAFRLLRYGYTYRRIYLGEGEWTIVEPADYYKFGHLKWSAAGENERFYAVRVLKQTIAGRVKTSFLHREILDAPKGTLVDHKNGDPLDNRRANLRLATAAQNRHNRRKIKTKTASIYIGVYFNKQIEKWGARIGYQGKRIYLGSFKTEIDAGRAYDEAAKKYHGEFARLNFPESADPASPKGYAVAGSV